MGELGEPPHLSLEDRSIEWSQGEPWSAVDTLSGEIFPKMERKASALSFCSENYIWGVMPYIAFEGRVKKYPGGCAINYP